MPIHPLPQFEADLKEHEDQLAYARLKPPDTIVVRYGSMKMVGEFPYRGDSKPGCGSKLVVQTYRGTELGEMLTSTCPNTGCSKAVSRQDMLQYIKNSGGRDYPFSTRGEVLRVATVEDLNTQSACEQAAHGLKVEARMVAEENRLALRVVDAERILGGETITYYVSSEERRPDPGDIRALQERMSALHGTRAEIKQVGARDEARLIADYERCGQYCCCKNFLKVLKPISMKSAKIQKQTLDPLKISGRCGRLMCCLRYEDETYEDLRKRLPRKKSNVGTPEGDGLVIDSQILTQLVLVELHRNGERIAVPVEDLTEPGLEPVAAPVERASEAGSPRESRPPRESRERRKPRERREPREAGERPRTAESPADAPRPDGEVRKKKKRRRKKRPGAEGMAPREPSLGDAGPIGPIGDDTPRTPTPDRGPGDASPESARPLGPDGLPRKKKRRRKKRRPPDGQGGGSPAPASE